MPLINIVYPHTRRTGHSEHKGDFTVILSAYPVEDCDMYVYQDAFAYFGERPGIEVLLMLEPYVVLPGEYKEEVWHYFDYVLTFVDGLAERGGKFRKINFPALPVYDERNTGKRLNPFRSLPLEQKSDAICLINGNKSSNVEGELYSKRKEIALWFHENSSFPCHVYGYPPFDLPNYKGAVKDKYSTLAKYKFAICFENVYHPFWSRGYVSEKILDCFMAETVPIYLGCYNIEDYIPSELFIDFRQFKNYRELDEFLHSISDDDYQKYLERIREWIKNGGLDDYSVYRLYDQLTTILQPDLTQEGSFSSSWRIGVSSKYRGKKMNLVRGHPLWSWDKLNQISNTKNSSYPHSGSNLKNISSYIRDSHWFVRYKKNITSQHGEDGVIEKIFQIIGEKSRWCVEFGAWDGKHLSNTWALINRKGWSAVLIEGDKSRSNDLKTLYKDNPRVTCLQAWVSDETPLDHLLAKTDIPLNYDLLSIDIDGDDYWVWKASTMYKPRVVVIETNPTFGPDILFVPQKGNHIGSSMRAMVELGKSKGYELVAYTNINCIFVLKEEFHKFGIKDNSCNAMFVSPFVPRLVSDMDGNHYLLKPGPWGLSRIMGQNELVSNATFLE